MSGLHYLELRAMAEETFFGDVLLNKATLFKLLYTAGFKSRNWRSKKSNPVAGSSTARRFDSCFSFSLAKGNVDTQKRIRDSSSGTIDVNLVHILYVDINY